MPLPTDHNRNPSVVIPRVRTTIIPGGAAGNHTVTGIATMDEIVSVRHLPPPTVAMSGTAAGTYTVTAGDDTAGSAAIATGLSSISGFSLLVVTAANVHRPLADAVITKSAGTITVADGGATFAVTATDLIYWKAQSTVAAAATHATPVDLTSQFSITAANTINNTGGTNTTGGSLVVIYYDHDWGQTVNAGWIG